MANDLALIEPIQLPAETNPAQLPSLPAWLTSRQDALGSATQPDSKGKYREMPVLPPALIPTSSQRTVIEQHVRGLSRFLDLSQPAIVRGQRMTNDEAHAVMIASLLIKGGGAKLDKDSSAALTEDYLDAIEDLPAWAVREALRKWNRGESASLDGKRHDFNWRPTPPILRKLAVLEMWGVRSRMSTLEKLLVAVPLIEFSDEHRANMLQKLSGVLHGLTDKPIPKPEENAA